MERARSRGAQAGANVERGRNRIRMFLDALGVEPQANESVMETLARALGIAVGEIRNMLRAGIDPIRKYLTEHGVFEEIERRKAAGTWPAAGGKKLRC